MKKKKITIISIFIIVLLTLLYVTKEFQNDTFYLIKVGESIVKNGIDFKDHFSFHNLPYLYPHFLFSVIVYVFYHLFSYNGIYLLTFIFSLILSFTIYYVNIKNSKNKIIPLITTLLFIIYMASFITLRAQIVSYTIFILEYYFINKLLDTNKNRYIGYLFLICVILVNSHVAVYPFFIILYFPFFAEYFINKIFKKKTRNIKKLLISFIITILSGLISPLFINSYTYLYNTLTNNTMDFIQEHQPPILCKDLRLLVMLLLAIFMFGQKKMKFILSDKFLILGLIIMAVTSIRHGSLFYLFMFIIINKMLSNFDIAIDVSNWIEKHICTFKGIFISIILVFIFSIPITIKNFKTDFINKKIYPVGAVEYIKNNLDYKNIRIFNTYENGSYLILNDIKVFIDSRSDLYTYSYNKKRDIYNDYIDVVDFKKYYEYVFDYYDIEYILFPSNSKLVVYLNEGNNRSVYATTYKDEYFTLLKRISKTS